MDEQAKDQAATDARPGSQESGPETGFNLPLVVFGVASIGFLIYVAFGSIEARIWRFGRLNFEDRTIRHVWSYFGDRLPDLPAQGLITILYWVALAVMVIGTVAGLWLFLGTSDDDPARETPAHDVEQPSSHA